MSNTMAEERVRAAFGVGHDSLWMMPWFGYLVAMMCGAAVFQEGTMHVATAVFGLPLAFAVGWTSRRVVAGVGVIAWALLIAAGFAIGAYGV